MATAPTFTYIYSIDGNEAIPFKAGDTIVAPANLSASAGKSLVINITTNTPGALTPAFDAQGVNLLNVSASQTAYSAGSTTLVISIGYVSGLGSRKLGLTVAASGSYAAVATFNVATLTFASAPVISAFSIPTQTYGAGTYKIPAPSESPLSAGAWSYESSNTAVATVSGSALTIVGAGTSTITAMQAAAGTYAPVYGSTTLTVNQTNPVIQPWSVASLVYGVGSVTITPPSSTNTTGAWSYVSSNTSVATISGSSIKVVGVGQTTITATQVASGNYLGGSVTATLTVSAGNPSIGSFTIPAQTYSPGGSFTLTAPTSGGSSGTWSYASSNTSIATISGSAVSIIGSGSCKITATLSAAGNYLGASTTATLTVAAATPTLGSFSVPSVIYGAAAFLLTDPTSNSSGAFSYSSSDPLVATISGSTVTIIGAGSCTITATQQANANYLAVIKTATLTVAKATPTVGAFTVATVTYGSSSFNLKAPTTTPSAPGVWSYTSSNTSVATISGSTVTIVGAGITNITATQAASANYSSVSTSASFTVNPANSPTLGALALPSPIYAAGSTFTLTAPTSGGSAGSWSYASSNPAVATVSGSTVTIIGAGTSTITATITASGTFSQGSTTSVLTVSQATPVIGALTIPAQTYAPSASIALTAPASGGSSGTWSYVSSNTSVATISGSTVSIQGVGTAKITATISSAGNYATTSTSASLIVNAATPTLSAFSIPAKTYGEAAFTLTAPTSPSSGSWSYNSSNTSVATISGSTVTIVGVGTSTLAATQTEAGNYLGNTITATLTVSAAAPSIGTFSIPAQTYAPGSSFQITPPTSGGSSGTWSYTSATTSVATISGNTVTIVGAGSSLITATLSASGNYAGASTTTILTVAKATPSLSWTIANAVLGSADFTLTAPSSASSGTWTYTSDTPATATVSSGGLVHLVASGSTTITASQAATANYTVASTTAVLTVNSTGAPTLGAFTVPAKIVGAANFTLTPPSTNSAGAWSYTSSNTAVATIVGTVVTVVGAGTSIITATQAAAGAYTSASATATLTVTNTTPSLTLPGNKSISYAPTATVNMAVVSNSNGLPSYSLGLGYPSGTSINPSTGKVSIGQALGQITVLYTQAAGAGFAAITTPVTAGVITVTQGTPVITPAPIQQIEYVAGEVLSITASSTSSAPLTYALGNGPAIVAPDGTVTITGAGTITIVASQPPSGDGLFAGTGTLLPTAGTIIVSAAAVYSVTPAFKSPTYIGNTGKLYMSAQDQLVVQPSKLAILTRTYSCALSYLPRARTVLSLGSTPYTPANAVSYPSVYLFRKPSESNNEAFSTLECQYYGVRDAGDLKQLYTTTGSEVRSVNGVYALYGSGLNSTSLSFTAKYVSPIITQSWVQYSSSPVNPVLPALPYDTAALFDVIFTNVNLTGTNVSNAPVPLNSLISQLGSINQTVSSIPGIMNAANFAIQNTSPSVSLIPEVVSIDSTNYGTVSEITVRYGAAISSGLNFQ